MFKHILTSTVLCGLVLAASCGKSEPGDSDATTTTPANPAPSTAPSAPSAVAQPPAIPQWLQTVLNAPFPDPHFDQKIDAVLQVPDHAAQLTALSIGADEGRCTDLIFVVAQLAHATQDPEYLSVASAISARLKAIGAADTQRVLVPMAYPPEVVGPQMLNALNDDSMSTVDLCGAVNWLSEWNGRDPASVAGLIDASAERLSALSARAMQHSDRDHAVLVLLITRSLRESGHLSRDDSLDLLDRWNAQFSHVGGLQTMYARIREVCEQPDR